MNRGDFNNTVFHRSVANFVIQGGGFRVGSPPQPINSDPAVRNEFSVSNRRGTIAMAKLDGQPNSATNQWFFNLSDNNTTILDRQNGGFTVFGRVADDESLAVMDRIAAVPIPNPAPLQSPFNEMPLIDYRGGQVTEANMVIVKSITILDGLPAPAITGIVSATSFGALSTATAGTFIEIYGTNLAGTTRSWGQSDFTGNRAPTSLDGVIVYVNQQPGYVYFVSPNQVNIQVPALVPANRDAPVTILFRGQMSEAAQVSLRPLAAGILAPASFKVGDKQYVAAAHSTGALVGNGTIPNVPAAPARPGETLTFYGIGFGPVTPTSFPIAGQVAAAPGTNVTTAVQFHIADQQAQIQYAGHVPGLVGLYQFNVTVPSSVPAGDASVRVTVSGEAIPQTMFLPVGSN